jgi:extracellular factor (EF) 3-hydroxypalmitic acid methyl ester biosynthesis protein
VHRGQEGVSDVTSARSLSNLITFRNSQGIQARGSLLKLSRTTLIVEVYNPYSIVQLSEVLNDVEIRSGDRVIYKGRAVVTNLVNTGLMLIVSARLVDTWSDLAGLVGDHTRIREEVTAFVEDWRESHQIQPEYQLAVSQIRSFLTELNRWLEHLDLQGDDYPPDLATQGRDELLEDLSEPLFPQLGEMFEQFEEAAAQVPEEERATHARYVQRDLHPLLLRAPFVHRAYYKPLGYAGDYEMVNMMLRNDNEGPTTYARIINSLHLQQGPAQAHRNRIDILDEWLGEALGEAETNGRPLTGLNVGCGPAVELQRLTRSSPAADRCQLRLMDFSDETLNYTRQRLREAAEHSGRSPQFEFVHESVHNLLRRASNPSGESDEHNYDIVYCAGLFDYLSDRVCSRLMRLFFQWIRPGGRVMVTNVHPSNPAFYRMEHILEWYLIYRDEDHMRQLVPPEWIRRVFVDHTGINVFMELEKPIEQDA